MRVQGCCPDREKKQPSCPMDNREACLTATDIIRAVGETAAIALPFLIAWVITKYMRSFFARLEQQDRLHLKGNPAFVVLRSILIAAVWAVGAFTALHNIPAFKKTWETVIATTSVAGVVLGLAAQETLGNVFSGIAMSIGESKPFSIGDRVKIGDADPGFVEDITLRHVEIRTYLNEHIYIPNSMAASAKIINYTNSAGFSYPIEIEVAYEADLQKAMQIMKEVIEHHPAYYDLNGGVSVLCKEAAESGILLRALVTTKQYADNPGACSDCLAEIIRRFTEEGIEIPYNKLEVVRSDVWVHKEKKSAKDHADA